MTLRARPEAKEGREWAIQAERLKRMIENLPAGAVYIENDDLHMNRAAEEITGHSRDALTTRDRWFKTLYGSKEKEARAHYEENRRAGFRECTATTITRRDGEEREIEFAAHGFDDHEVWFLNDVTEQKQAEFRLLESEAQKEAILASLSAHIAVVDRTGTIVAVNPGWDDFVLANEGDRAKCAVGANYLAVCRHAKGEGSELSKGVATALQAILDGSEEAFSIEYPCHSSSEKRWFLLQATPLLGKTPGAVLSHTDISDRVRTEQALRHEHDFNEKIIDTAQTVVLVLDREGRVVRFNPYFEELSGWRLEEAEGRDWFENFLPERDRDRIATLFKGSLKGHRTLGSINSILTKEGEERQIEWFDAPLTDTEGKITGLLCTGTDVTERSMLEREVVSASEEERQRTARDLHDGLASLLTGVDYRVQAVAKDLSRLDVPQAGIRTISALIRDAIVQTRAISKGLHPVGSHPEDLMNALRALASQAYPASSATCRFRCDAPVLIDDPQRANHLFRIAQEAVNNAIKHSNATRITLSLAKDSNGLILKITDNGSGFDPASRDPKAWACTSWNTDPAPWTAR